VTSADGRIAKRPAKAGGCPFPDASIFGSGEIFREPVVFS